MNKKILIQIVDENDSPVGEATIAEAHNKGLIHRIVRIMVQNPKGQILLQKRASKKLDWPNCWDNSAAGHVDVGEDYMTAALRELSEEIGVQNVKLTEIGSYYTDEKLGKKTLRRFNHVYKAAIDHTPKQLQPEEVTEVRWFWVDEAKKLVKEHPDQVTDGLEDVLVRFYKPS